MAATNIQPLDDRLVIQRLDAEEKTAGGIVLPDSAKEKPQEAEVVAIGNGRLGDDGNRIPMEVKVGDTVIFGKFSGDDIKVGEDEFKIVRESDVLAIVD